MPGKYSVPLSEADWAEVDFQFKSLPTYRDEKGDGVGYALATDMKEICDIFGLPTTQGQREAYQTYWNKAHEGRIPLDAYHDIIELILAEDTTGLALFYSDFTDKNRDGFIDHEEFEDLLMFLSAYDPKLRGRVSFTEFLAEADTNHDGKVSVEECGTWVNKEIQSSKINRSAFDPGDI